MTPEPTFTTVWVDRRTWSEPDQRLEQEVHPAAFGAPEDPMHAGRLAVDQHGDDLQQLADS